MVANRQEIEQLIYDTFDAMDPTGMNTARYRKEFSSMDDKQFEKFMKSFLKDSNENFILELSEFENDLKMENMEVKIQDLCLIYHMSFQQL